MQSLSLRFPQIPPAQSGKQEDLAEVLNLSTENQAEQHYVASRQRLLSINGWHNVAPKARVEFKLINQQGEALEVPAVGAYIRIDIPGPGSLRGQGYDWVQIIALEEEKQPLPWVSLTIKPCAKPEEAPTQAAHFYQAGGSNTFVVRRLGKSVFAEVYSRNLEVNNQQGPLADKLRNTAVALGGKLGLSGINWQYFLKAFLAKA